MYARFTTEVPNTNERWIDCWNEDRTPWHNSSVNSNLIENIGLLTNGRSNLRILVPLCGKTVDIPWLVKQGHIVIGVELSEKAIDMFFKEQEIPFEKEKITIGDKDWYIYTALDGKLKMFNCDFMVLDSTILGGKVDAIWDNSSIGALGPDLGKPYGKKCLELLSDSRDRRILQQSFYYDPKEMNGPPFSLSLDELAECFGGKFQLQVLSLKPEEDKRELFGLSWLSTRLVLMKPCDV